MLSARGARRPSNASASSPAAVARIRCSNASGTASRCGRPSALCVPAARSAELAFRRRRQSRMHGQPSTTTSRLLEGRRPCAYIDELLPDVLEGRIESGRVFDRVIPLDGVSDGYKAMNDRQAIKVINEI